MLRDRVVFVLGAPRSGTTWLSTMLTAHPELVGATESHLFDEGVDRLFDNIEATDWERSRFLRSYLTRHELIDLIRDLCDGIFLRMRDRWKPTGRLIVEKTPFGTAAPDVELRRKLDCYPDARYIHIVRDPRAVARSSSRRWAQPVAHSARLWLQSVCAVKDQLAGHPGYRELRYEDLVANPVATMHDLFAWLGVACDDQSDELVRLAAERQIESRSGASASNVASWARDLSPAAIFTIEYVAGAVMTEYGYELVRPEVPRYWRLAQSARRRMRTVALARRAASLGHDLRTRYASKSTPDALERPPDERLSVMMSDVANAFAHRDERALRSLMVAECEVEVRLAAETQTAKADAGIRLLLDTSKLLVDETFVRTDWMASAARPLSTVWFRGTRAVGGPVEFALALAIDEDLIARVALLGYGPD